MEAHGKVESCLCPLWHIFILLIFILSIWRGLWLIGDQSCALINLLICRWCKVPVEDFCTRIYFNLICDDEPMITRLHPIHLILINLMLIDIARDPTYTVLFKRLLLT